MLHFMQGRGKGKKSFIAHIDTKANTISFEQVEGETFTFKEIKFLLQNVLDAMVPYDKSNE